MSTATIVELLVAAPSILALIVGGLWVLGRSLRSDRREAVSVATATEARTVRIEEAVKDIRHDVRAHDERIRGLESRRDRP